MDERFGYARVTINGVTSPAHFHCVAEQEQAAAMTAEDNDIGSMNDQESIDTTPMKRR